MPKCGLALSWWHKQGRRKYACRHTLLWNIIMVASQVWPFQAHNTTMNCNTNTISIGALSSIYKRNFKIWFIESQVSFLLLLSPSWKSSGSEEAEKITHSVLFFLCLSTVSINFSSNIVVKPTFSLLRMLFLHVSSLLLHQSQHCSELSYSFQQISLFYFQLNEWFSVRVAHYRSVIQ